MSLITIEVAIDHGKIIPREPAMLPENGKGLLTILTADEIGSSIGAQRGRIKLPLIPGEPGEIINPTREELDASVWG